MDADGLPLVGPGIDYTKVEAINQKRTIAFINHFVSHTARFLNHFSGVCEDKLTDLTVRIQRLEFTMSILETKLSSIPGLENVTAPSSTATTTTESTPTASSVTPVDTPTTQNPAPPTEAPQAVAESEPEKTVSQDSRYARFFKMLQVGVPPPAVKIKMTAEGLDSSLLDTPDAPAPPEDAPADSDDDFSEASDDDSSGFSD